MKKARLWRQSGQAKLTGRLCGLRRHHGARQHPSGRWPLRSRRAITRPCSRFPATCRAKCRASITSKPPIQICCFAMCRSTRKPSIRRSRPPPSSIRRSPRPTRAAASPISHCRKTSSWREPQRRRRQRGHSAGRARRSRRARRTSPEIARRIDAAGSVLSCPGRLPWGRRRAPALSDRLKAPLIHSVKGQDIMAYDDPHWMGGVGMIGSRPVEGAA